MRGTATLEGLLAFAWGFEGDYRVNDSGAHDARPSSKFEGSPATRRLTIFGISSFIGRRLACSR
jgi:hypothetical protein